MRGSGASVHDRSASRSVPDVFLYVGWTTTPAGLSTTISRSSSYRINRLFLLGNRDRRAELERDQRFGRDHGRVAAHRGPGAAADQRADRRAFAAARDGADRGARARADADLRRVLALV